MEIKAKLKKPYTENERLDFIVQYQGSKIQETETELQAWGYTQEELEAQKKERIQELFMTRSDFFDGTILAWGVGQDELLVLIQTLLATLPMEDVKKLIAINNFKNALNFYRKHDLFKMLTNIPIPLTETLQVTITDEQWDKFFNETDKKNPEAYKELPTPELIPVEPEEEEPVEEEVTDVEIIDETTEVE